MAYLDVDLTIPIVLLVGSVVAVILMRMAVVRGQRRSREKTRRLIERHGMP